MSDPPEVNWGDDDWSDDPRTRRLLAENQRLRAFINTAQCQWFHGNEDSLDHLLETGRIESIQVEQRPCGCWVERGYPCYACEEVSWDE